MTTRKGMAAAAVAWLAWWCVPAAAITAQEAEANPDRRVVYLVEEEGGSLAERASQVSNKDELEEVLRESLAEMLGLLRRGAEAGAAFAQEQLPLLLQEIVTFYVVLYSISLILALITLLAGILALRRAIKGGDFASDAAEAACWVVAVFGTVGGGIWFLVQLYSWAKVVFAPRLFLVEYLAGLLR